MSKRLPFYQPKNPTNSHNDIGSVARFLNTLASMGICHAWGINEWAVQQIAITDWYFLNVYEPNQRTLLKKEQYV
jgi:hypothetical protein